MKRPRQSALWLLFGRRLTSSSAPVEAHDNPVHDAAT